MQWRRTTKRKNDVLLFFFFIIVKNQSLYQLKEMMFLNYIL